MNNIERRSLDKEEIEKILPHRGRALLLDRVEFDGDKTIGYLTVREEHCEGHLPGFPIMRGVDRIEMIALTLGVAARTQLPEGYLPFLAKIVGARFPALAKPGDTIRSEVAITKISKRIIQGSGKAFVEEQVVAEVQEITCVISKMQEKRRFGESVNI